VRHALTSRTDRRWVGRQNFFLACHLQSEDVDLAIRSEGGSEQIAVGISFVSSPKRSPGRAAIALHEELVMPPTCRASNCQMVRSRQPTGVLIYMV
jgi:hypothetical protein